MFKNVFAGYFFIQQIIAYLDLEKKKIYYKILKSNNTNLCLVKRILNKAMTDLTLPKKKNIYNNSITRSEMIV